MNSFRKYNILALLALLTQWVVFIGIPLFCSYYYLYPISPVTFWGASSTYIVLLVSIKASLTKLNFKLYFSQLPKTVLSDNGFVYAHFGTDFTLDKKSKYGDRNIYLFKNNFLYWKIIAKSTGHNRYDIYDLDLLKLKINQMHEDYLKDQKDKLERRKVNFRKWDGIATEKKEILRDITIDKVLED